MKFFIGAALAFGLVAHVSAADVPPNAVNRGTASADRLASPQVLLEGQPAPPGIPYIARVTFYARNNPYNDYWYATGFTLPDLPGWILTVDPSPGSRVAHQSPADPIRVVVQMNDVATDQPQQQVLVVDQVLPLRGSRLTALHVAGGDTLPMAPVVPNFNWHDRNNRLRIYAFGRPGTSNRLNMAHGHYEDSEHIPTYPNIRYEGLVLPYPIGSDQFPTLEEGDVGAPVLAYHNGQYQVAGLLASWAPLMGRGGGPNTGTRTVYWYPLYDYMLVDIESESRPPGSLLFLEPHMLRLIYGNNAYCRSSQMVRHARRSSAASDTPCPSIAWIRVFYKWASDGDSWKNATWIDVPASEKQVTIPLPDQPGRVWAVTIEELDKNKQPLSPADTDGKPLPGDAGGAVVMTTTEHSMPADTLLSDQGSGLGNLAATFEPSTTAPGALPVQAYWIYCIDDTRAWAQARKYRVLATMSANPVALIPLSDFNKQGWIKCTVLPELSDGTILGADSSGYPQTDANGHLVSNTAARFFRGAWPTRTPAASLSALVPVLSLLLQ